MTVTTHAQPGPAQATSLAAALLLMAFLCGVMLSDGLEKISAAALVVWGLWQGLVRDGFRHTTAAERGLFLCFALVLLAALLSYFVNGRPEAAVKMLPKYARFLLFIPLYVLFRGTLQTRHLWLAFAGAAGILGVWNLLEGSGLVEGCFKEQCSPGQITGSISRTAYGLISLALAGVVAAASGYYQRRHSRLALATVVATTLVLYGALASGNRTALLALPGMVLVWLFLAWWIGDLRTRLLVILALSLGCALTAAWPVIETRMDEAQKEIASYRAHGSGAPSIGSRLQWWRSALHIFQEHPLVGVGPRQFRPELARRIAAGLEPAQALPHHPHNEYLSTAAGRGLFGLMALLLLLAWPLLWYWRGCTSTALDRRETGMAGILMVAAFAQSALTESIFDLSAFTGFYVMASAALCALVNPTRNLQDNSRQ